MAAAATAPTPGIDSRRWRRLRALTASRTARSTRASPGAILKALRKNGLDVVAIHHHMTGTQPTIYFLHYWGTGPADKLAAGFKAALDLLATPKTTAAKH